MFDLFFNTYKSIDSYYFLVGVYDGYKQFSEDVNTDNTSEGYATKVLFVALDDRSVRFECYCHNNSDQKRWETFWFKLKAHTSLLQ